MKERLNKILNATLSQKPMGKVSNPFFTFDPKIFLGLSVFIMVFAGVFGKKTHPKFIAKAEASTLAKKSKFGNSNPEFVYEIVKQGEGELHLHPALELANSYPKTYQEAIEQGKLMFSYSIHYSTMGGVNLYRKHCGHINPQLVYENLLNGRKSNGVSIRKQEAINAFKKLLIRLYEREAYYFNFNDSRSDLVVGYMYHFGENVWQDNNYYLDEAQINLANALLEGNREEIITAYYEANKPEKKGLKKAFMNRAKNDLKLL